MYNYPEYEKYASQLRKSNGTLGIDKDPIETDKGWYFIPNYSRYRISKDYRLLDTVTREEVAITYNLNDYPLVHIARDDRGRVVKKKCDFHRLVALAFLPVPKEDFGERIEVDHVDGTRTNFNVENLEWVTKTENYMRGRATARAKKKGIIYRVLNRFRGNDCLVDTLEVACEMVGADIEEAKQDIELCNQHRTDSWTIIRINIEKDTGYRNPVYVWDAVDGSVFICRSVQDAINMTNVSKSGIETSLKSSMLPECMYIKGYKFFNVCDIPDELDKVTMGEALFWSYIRRYFTKTGATTCGYIVHDNDANKAYAAMSLSDIETRISGVTKRDIMSALKYGIALKGCFFYPIYQIKSDGTNSRLLPFITDEYDKFSRTFKGEFILSNDKIK